MPLNRASRDRRQRPVIYLRLLSVPKSAPRGHSRLDPRVYTSASYDMSPKGFRYLSPGNY